VSNPQNMPPPPKIRIHVYNHHHPMFFCVIFLSLPLSYLPLSSAHTFTRSSFNSKTAAETVHIITLCSSVSSCYFSRSFVFLFRPPTHLPLEAPSQRQRPRRYTCNLRAVHTHSHIDTDTCTQTQTQHADTDRQIDRQTGRQAETQKHRQTNGQTDR